MREKRERWKEEGMEEWKEYKENERSKEEKIAGYEKLRGVVTMLSWQKILFLMFLIYFFSSYYVFSLCNYTQLTSEKKTFMIFFLLNPFLY